MNFDSSNYMFYEFIEVSDSPSGHVFPGVKFGKFFLPISIQGRKGENAYGGPR